MLEQIIYFVANVHSYPYGIPSYLLSHLCNGTHSEANLKLVRETPAAAIKAGNNWYGLGDRVYPYKHYINNFFHKMGRILITVFVH